MTRPIAVPGAIDAPGPTPAPRRIVAILGHPLMLNGVRAVISGHDGIEVVGTAASLADGRRLIATVRHDIVIADLDLPDGSALGIVDARRDGVRTILLTEDPTRPALEDALARGARGFIAATLRGPRSSTPSSWWREVVWPSSPAWARLGGPDRRGGWRRSNAPS